MRRVLLLSTLLVLTSHCAGQPPATAASDRSGLGASTGVLVLGELPPLAVAEPEVVVRAGWGQGQGEVSRELVGARTGPMALAIEPGGGGDVMLLDTVGGRVLRFDERGALRATVRIGVETGDDLALLPDGSFAVLAYHRLPAPGYELLTFSADGAAQGRLEAPQAATMPTALLADGAVLAVENRHSAVFPANGAPRLWGRPAGAGLLVRAAVADGGGLVTVTARERAGQLVWERSVEVPWTVVEVLALQACDASVGLVVRGIEPGSHETFLVALGSEAGAPLGALRLLDERITDSGRPVALGPGGDVYELATDEAGATVLRYRALEEGAR